MQSTTNGGKALDRAFSFLWLVIKRKKEKVCIFSRQQKMSNGGCAEFLLWRIYGTVIIWICLNYVISKNILLICQKTSLQLPVDIFPYLNGGYATDNIAKITP